MRTVVTTVGTTAVVVVPADDLTREVILHSGTGSVYIGSSTVTSATGVHMANGSTLVFTVPAKQDLWAVTPAATQTFIALMPDGD